LNNDELTDDELQKQTAKAAKKWREILERVTVTIKNLAQQKLPLRGHCQSLISDTNPRHFMALLKNLAKFDPVRRHHLDSGSGKPGCVIHFSRHSK
jgi:predicted  nucleic acid-binding Zn-ribbon protein